MKKLVYAGLLAAFVWTGASPAMAEAELTLPEVGPNEEGLHVQPWFLDTFRDVREDMQEAADAGKQVAILFEQKGCPYCREMHRVNMTTISSMPRCWTRCRLTTRCFCTTGPTTSVG